MTNFDTPRKAQPPALPLWKRYFVRMTRFSLFTRYSLALVLGMLAITGSFTACKIYTFNDASIPKEVKTIKISYFENKARTINPQLGSRLTEAFQQKVSNQTKLTRTNDDNAHYQVSGFISTYNVSTSAISTQQAATNRLTVGVHVVFRNLLEPNPDKQVKEYDISRDFDFSAGLTLTQVETQLMGDIVKNLSDEMFNRIFSNW